jgi:hypothetical protein
MSLEKEKTQKSKEKAETAETKTETAKGQPAELLYMFSTPIPGSTTYIHGLGVASSF